MAPCKCFKALFIVIPVFYRERILVFKCEHGISEIHAMFAQIIGRLPRVPCVIRHLSVCTNGVRYKFYPESGGWWPMESKNNITNR